jgi:hypothetical protein
MGKSAVAYGIIAILLLMWWAPWIPEIRYRITIEVETPQGIRKGSSVWSTRLRKVPIVGGHTTDFRGEAIAVELPNNQVLFGLIVNSGPTGQLGGNYGGWLPESVHESRGFERPRRPREDYSAVEDFKYIRDLPSRLFMLDCEERRECPFLVRFRDLNDRSTVEGVDYDGLHEAFGPGYRLRAVTLETTGARPRRNLHDYLPWVDGPGEASFKPDHHPLDHSLAARMHNWHFQQWD